MDGFKHDVGSLEPYLLQKSVRRTGYSTDAPLMGTTVAKVIFVDFSLAVRILARGLP